MAATLAKASSDAKRVFHLMNAALVLERMSAKVSQFTSNPDEVETTADSLSRDMKFMETTFNALLDGNATIEISAEPDAAMRARLSEARKPMESAFISIRALLADKQTILELSETSARIAESAAALGRQARNARIRATD